MEHIIETERKTEVAGNYDVIVAGGGPAGIIAALSAARNGAKTLIVERWGFLGGNLTAGYVMNIRNYSDNAGNVIIGGISLEFVQRLEKIGGTLGKPSAPLVRQSPEHVKFLCDTMMSEAGVEILYHSFIAGAFTENNKVKGIIVENKSGRQVFLADVVIDATGDGDVIYHSGADFFKSPDKSGLQPMTLAFIMGGVPTDTWPDVVTEERYFAFQNAYDKYGYPSKNRSFALFPTLRKGEVYANITRSFGDCTNAKDITMSEIECRKQVHELIEWFRKYIPGFRDCYLVSTAPQTGTRESRRLKGLYTLTREDILGYREFDDRICRGAYGIDVHSGRDDTGIMIHLKPGFSYTIPYRCLVPEKIDGLIAAGRCVSADREALGSIRVMAICMAMGEAAGAAAALSVSSGKEPKNIDIKGLKEILIRQKVILDA
ncbi:MAG: HI0933 family protein [Candidatus Uhrbacteria bacterium GW2011_GWF2_39_13]|uniref:HI0933 family protein n=1 Tax=Candidatus Uhrbacteria bacterium GW2011_GWF2_39_13 TaxID=1618995 RepID=A0A0G0Q1V8_9BACT|nr:MAG: HI0933 family protein [Candidatus Uhrbacteria bacterium GW2011_GWF2_39_13]